MREQTNNTNEGRYFAIDYLRGFLTVLVVLHHTMLSYTTHGTAALIVDRAKFAGFDWAVGLFDIFFMSLFFFVSGLFTLKSVDKKGAGAFLRGRLLRLGVPFLIGWLIINIPAYYFNMLNRAGVSASIGGFFDYWADTLGGNTAGPLWFVWVLFVFDCMIVLIYKLAPKMCENIRSREKSWLSRPWAFLTVFFGLAVAAYLPLAKLADGRFILVFGPFAIQISRVLLYFLFFFVGGLMGVIGLPRSVFAQSKPLVKRWWLPLLIGIIVFPFMYDLYVTVLKNGGEWWVMIALALMFLVACICVCYGLLGMFIRYTKRENAFMRSLSDNAYGIYIFHYSVVTSWQFAFIAAAMSGLAKGISVFLLSLATTWAIVWLVRRIKLVRKVIG